MAITTARDREINFLRSTFRWIKMHNNITCSKILQSMNKNIVSTTVCMKTSQYKKDNLSTRILTDTVSWIKDKWQLPFINPRRVSVLWQYSTSVVRQLQCAATNPSHDSSQQAIFLGDEYNSQCSERQSGKWVDSSLVIHNFSDEKLLVVKSEDLQNVKKNLRDVTISMSCNDNVRNAPKNNPKFLS